MLNQTLAARDLTPLVTERHEIRSIGAMRHGHPLLVEITPQTLQTAARLNDVTHQRSSMRSN